MGKRFVVATMKQNEWGATQKEVEQKESISRAEHMIQNQVMVEAGRYKNGNERQSCFMLGSQRPQCHEREKHALLTANRTLGRKIKCQVRLTGTNRECCMHAEVSSLGSYCF